MSRNLIHRSPCVVHPKSSRLFTDRVFTIRAKSHLIQLKSMLAMVKLSILQFSFHSIQWYPKHKDQILSKCCIIHSTLEIFFLTITACPWYSLEFLTWKHGLNANAQIQTGSPAHLLWGQDSFSPVSYDIFPVPQGNRNSRFLFHRQEERSPYK